MDKATFTQAWRDLRAADVGTQHKAMHLLASHGLALHRVSAGDFWLMAAHEDRGYSFKALRHAADCRKRGQIDRAVRRLEMARTLVGVALP